PSGPGRPLPRSWISRPCRRGEKASLRRSAGNLAARRGGSNWLTRREEPPEIEEVDEEVGEDRGQEGARPGRERAEDEPEDEREDGPGSELLGDRGMAQREGDRDERDPEERGSRGVR